MFNCLIPTNKPKIVESDARVTEFKFSPVSTARLNETHRDSQRIEGLPGTPYDTVGPQRLNRTRDVVGAEEAMTPSEWLLRIQLVGAFDRGGGRCRQ